MFQLQRLSLGFYLHKVVFFNPNLGDIYTSAQLCFKKQGLLCDKWGRRHMKWEAHTGDGQDV